MAECSYIWRVPSAVLCIYFVVCGLVAAEMTHNEKIRVLGHQIMEQQLFEQERIRSAGRSGLKQIRHDMSGTFPYYSNSHTRAEIAKIHDHGDNIRTIGLGEFVAVLNGVEFRTRHNDYRLYMPHSTSDQLHAMEDIPFPDVPPEVLEKPTVQEQIDEMREWFRAWGTQNTTHRDYTQYFKPVLCYLEGAWYDAEDTIEETLWSDRHSLDAETYSELFDINAYLSYTGTMNSNENIAYLPKQLIGFENETSSVPKFAQFSYRMLCQPLNRDIPLNRFKAVDDLSLRVPYKMRVNQMYDSKATRFVLNPVDSDSWRDGHYRYSFLDELMKQVPGLNNKGAHVTDDSYDIPTYDYLNTNTPLNAGYYHRWFKAGLGSSRQIRSRGFSDDNFFIAFTDQEKVSKVKLPICQGSGEDRQCHVMKRSASFALPFEIVYMTPLSNWNPYNIVFHKVSEDVGVTANGRNGGLTEGKAYDGVSEKTYYRTPSEFFTGDKVGEGNYNTAYGDKGVLNANGVMKVVREAGHHIIKDIQGVGRLRQRFPIMPLHDEGSPLWKEVEALKQIVLRQKTFGYLYDGY